jgi:hypothetical protein
MEVKRQRTRGEPRRSRTTPKASAPATGEAAGNSRPASKRTAAKTTKPRHTMIAEAAYFLAERRGFAPGQELDDWLQAEAEVDVLVERVKERKRVASSRTH